MASVRPEPGASLDHLCVQSEDPARLAVFFESHYGMTSEVDGTIWRCEADGRTILTTAGKQNSVAFFAYSFADQSALEIYRGQLEARGAKLEGNPSPLFGVDAFSLVDPDGNRVAFGVRGVAPSPSATRLQHIAFRTTNVNSALDFYTKVVGFVVSDLVKDDEGNIRACFLRSDQEHHALALFAAPVCRLDHHSYETTDIMALANWADRVSGAGTPIHWGVGRHGPGNDVFFMVKDPDDNLVEISTELEQCAAERPAGTWKHEQKTLNLWGTALMRS